MPDQRTTTTTHPTLMTRGPVRWWAIGSVLAVALVLLATVSGRSLSTQARQAANNLPAPAWPLLSAQALAGSPPGMRAQTVAVAAGQIVALFTNETPPCPSGACPTRGPVGMIEMLDGPSGHVLARQSLEATPVALSARWLLADLAARRVYAVGSAGVAVFSLDDMRTLAQWPLSDIEVVGATLDGQGDLDLATTHMLLALDTANGRIVAYQALPTGRDITFSGLVYDGGADALALLVNRSGSAPRLARFRASSLQPLGTLTLPMGMVLGPADPRGGVRLFGVGGRVWWLKPPAADASDAPPALTEQPLLRGARALGWDMTRGWTLALTPNGLLVHSSRGETPLAGLPLSVAWPAEQPLAVDGAQGLLALPVGADGVLIVRETTPPRTAPLDVTTASLLARTALARLLPPQSQQPPFFRATDLPIAAGTRAWSFWVHSSDLGWLGPFAGTLSTTITPESGQPGAYTVTYAVAWEQLFRRIHTWRLVVAPDGAVRLTAERGDALS